MIGSRRWNWNSGKSIFEIRIPNFCYIQVIVFDLNYLPMAAVGTKQVRYYEKIVKNIKSVWFWVETVTATCTFQAMIHLLHFIIMIYMGSNISDSTHSDLVGVWTSNFLQFNMLKLFWKSDISVFGLNVKCSKCSLFIIMVYTVTLLQLHLLPMWYSESISPGSSMCWQYKNF